LLSGWRRPPFFLVHPGNRATIGMV
jgi:hypothetical protein